MRNIQATPKPNLNPIDTLRAIDPTCTIGTVLATATAMNIWHGGRALRRTPIYHHRSRTGPGGGGATIGSYQGRPTYNVQLAPGTTMQTRTIPRRTPDSPMYDVVVFPIAAVTSVEYCDAPTSGSPDRMWD
jgi:hypothetical protein